MVQPTVATHSNQSPPSPTRSKSAEESVRDELKGLKEALKERDELVGSQRTVIVEHTVQLHKFKKN